MRTAVPELLEIQRRIKNGRCIHPSERTVHAFGITPVIDTARMQAVARSAGNRIVGRQARIVVKHLAERRLACVGRQRIGQRLHGFTCKTRSGGWIAVIGNAMVMNPLQQLGLFRIGNR